MTVYVVHSTRDPISDSFRFGEPYFINHDYIYNDQIMESEGEIPPKMLEAMERCADRFKPDKDYLLIVGDHLQIIAFSAMLSRRYDYFSVLRWDRIDKYYFPVRIIPRLIAKKSRPQASESSDLTLT